MGVRQFSSLSLTSAAPVGRAHVSAFEKNRTITMAIVAATLTAIVITTSIARFIAIVIAINHYGSI